MLRYFKKANIKYKPGYLHFPPEWLILGVNNLCNLHCKMCDVGTKYEGSNFYYNLMGSRPLNMPLDLLKKVMDDAHQYYPKAKLGYAFTEPLIYPDLVPSLQYARSLNLYTGITTNALNLEHKAEDILIAGVNALYISLDGPEETHNFIRGHKSSFQRAIKGMEKVFELDKAKTTEVSVFCTITEWNYDKLFEFVTYFKDFPLTTLGFMHSNYTSNPVVDAHNKQYPKYQATASNVEGVDLSKIDLEVLLDQINQIRSVEWNFPVVISPEKNNIEELKVFYHQPEKLVGKSCSDVFRTIMIKSDGSCIPAHGRCYPVDAGNIYDQNIKEIWNSNNLSQFRRDLTKAGGLLPACSRCCSAF